MSSNKVRIILISAVIILIVVFFAFIFIEKAGKHVEENETAIDTEEKVDDVNDNDNVIAYKIEVKDDGKNVVLDEDFTKSENETEDEEGRIEQNNKDLIDYKIIKNENGLFIEYDNKKHFLLDSQFSKIATWGNMIFYTDHHSTENVKVFYYDLKRGVRGIVYEQSKRNDFPDEMPKYRYISELIVIKDNLFFSINKEKTFVIALPVNSGKDGVSLFFDKALTFALTSNNSYLAHHESGMFLRYYDFNPENKELKFRGTSTKPVWDQNIIYMDRKIIMQYYYNEHATRRNNKNGTIKEVYYLDVSTGKKYVNLYDNSRFWDDFNEVFFKPETNELILSNDISSYYYYVGDKFLQEYTLNEKDSNKVNLDDLGISFSYPKSFGNYCFLKLQGKEGLSRAITFSNNNNLCSNRFDGIRLSYASKYFQDNREYSASEQFANDNNLDFESCDDLKKSYANINDCKEIKTLFGSAFKYDITDGKIIGVLPFKFNDFSILSIEASQEYSYYIDDFFFSLNLIEE